jgi:hypothetical protein
MVVDLGAVSAITGVVLQWTSGVVPSAALETSVDGRTYQTVGPAPFGRRITIPVATTARYVAVTTGWRSGQAALAALIVRP